MRGALVALFTGLLVGCMAPPSALPESAGVNNGGWGWGAVR